jgi:hypothetical protein
MHPNFGIRAFRLSSGDDNGVSCDGRGVFIGSIPLLTCTRDAAGRDVWRARSEVDLNRELTRAYGMPIDIAAKSGGLATIVRAYNSNNVVLAKIAAVQLQFPDPPKAGFDETNEELLRRATELCWSGLLKVDDDWNEKHPRTGTKPNPGQFARVPKEPKLPAKPGWPSKPVNSAMRTKIKEVAAKVAQMVPALALGPVGEALLILGEIDTVLEGLKAAFGISALNQGEDRLVAQMKTNFDPPKTLEELQMTPTKNILGYDRHHLVEQNDDNIAKSDVDAWFEKFGREKIEDPSNIAWVPRLKHEKISADYSKKDNTDPKGRTRRAVVKAMDFEAQRQEGLQKLREYGVLK